MDQLVQSFGFGLVTASLLALAGVGFTLQFGIAGFFNLSYGAIMTASAFAAYSLSERGLNVWLSVAAGGLVGSALSLALNHFVFAPFQKRGTGFFGMVVVTLAIGLLIQNAIVAIGGITFFTYSAVSETTYRVAGMIFTTSQLVIIALAIVCMLAVHFLLNSTQLGRSMRATASNATLARACGIDTARAIGANWAISGALCGIAGVGLVLSIGTFQSTTGEAFMPLAVAAAMLGGVGQPYGAMVGAVIVGVGTEMAATYMDPIYKTVVALALIVIVILLRPYGVLGTEPGGGSSGTSG